MRIRGVQPGLIEAALPRCPLLSRSNATAAGDNSYVNDTDTVVPAICLHCRFDRLILALATARVAAAIANFITLEVHNFI